MAVSLTIPTPPGGGQEVRITLGKVTRVWDNAAAAADWARSQISSESDLLFTLLILLAADRPGVRGKTLTVNLAAPATLAGVS